MAGTSEIEWTDVTWNPVAGCTIASSGCTNCYAMRMAARLQAMGHAKYRGTTRKSGSRYVWTGRVNLDDFSLSAPLEWRKPKRIFVNSMSDLFHADVPDDFIRRVWDVMAECPQHHFQVLTKRPDRMGELFATPKIAALVNVWVGTSVESAEVADRVRHLANIKGATRFVSFEPLIGKIDEIDLRGVHWAIVGGNPDLGHVRWRKPGLKDSMRFAGATTLLSSSSNGVEETRKRRVASCTVGPMMSFRLICRSRKTSGN